MARKILLLYCSTKSTPEFTQAQCNNFVNNSGATEFLIVNNTYYNYCQPNDAILRYDWVSDFDNVPASYYGTTSTSQINDIKAKMKAAIDKYNKDDSSVHNLTAYVDRCVSLVKKLVNADSNCKIWLTFPVLLYDCYVAAVRYNYYYETYILNAFKTKLTASGHWDNIVGFYYSNESIEPWFTNFDNSAVNSQFNNPVVMNMKYLSDKVKAQGKKMLWIPYYRSPSGDDRYSRLAYVANKTNIFDYVILQPTYYFDASLGASNVTLVKNCVTSQACKYSSGSTVGGSKTSSTDIGAEMELNSYYTKGNGSTSAAEYKSRYETYGDNLSGFITGSPKRDVAFYAGNPDEITQSAVFNRVSSFFNDGE